MYRLALLLLAALTLAGCDANDPAPPPDAGDPDPVDLLPLDIGNRWITDFTRTEPDGTVIETVRDTLSVVRDTLVAGERWFRVETSLDRLAVPAGWYTNRENGVWKWRDSVAEAYLIYQYPAEQGDTYTIPGEAGFTVTVADTDFPVETSQGTFSGYLYEWNTDEAAGFPVAQGEGRLDRVMIPGQGFAFVGCSYLGDRGNENGLVVTQRLDWELISFEAAP